MLTPINESTKHIEDYCTIGYASIWDDIYYDTHGWLIGSCFLLHWFLPQNYHIIWWVEEILHQLKTVVYFWMGFNHPRMVVQDFFHHFHHLISTTACS